MQWHPIHLFTSIPLQEIVNYIDVTPTEGTDRSSLRKFFLAERCQLDIQYWKLAENLHGKIIDLINKSAEKCDDQRACCEQFKSRI